ncbi:MAG TPA: histidine-type phosphatase, partial [Chroococcales cyanobacterium]
LEADKKAALPGGLQPIPIHSRPRNEDQVLIPDSNSGAGELVKKLVYEGAPWKEKTEKLRPKFERWSKLTGMTITNLNQISGLGDNLHIYQLHHVPMPKGFTDEDVKEIMETGEWSYAAIFRPRPVGSAVAHDLLALVDSYLEDAVKPSNKLKWVLLSAHDSTISGVMSALGAPLDARTRYASDLNFALYKQGNDLSVHVTLNGEPVHFAGAKDGYCSLFDFKKVLND